MDATKLKDIVTSAIGREQLEEFARELGAVKRQSKVHMMELVTALILAARTNAGGRQAEAMRVFRDHLGGARIARSTYYERFNSGLVALMQCLLDRALEAARADPVRLPPFDRVRRGLADPGRDDGEAARRAGADVPGRG